MSSLRVVNHRGEDLYVRFERVKAGEEVLHWEFVRPDVPITDEERRAIDEQMRKMYIE